METVILEKKKVPMREFLEFWSRSYDSAHPNEILYTENIGREYTEENLRKLFIWKNTSNLSKSKTSAFDEKILKELKFILDKRNQDDFTFEQHSKKFSKVSAVWRIFLFHIINPDRNPIYDQHVHRAYNYIHSLDFEHVTSSIGDQRKIEFYSEKLLPFVHDNRGDLTIKQVDQALFSFGRFLKNHQLRTFH